MLFPWTVPFCDTQNNKLIAWSIIFYSFKLTAMRDNGRALGRIFKSNRNSLEELPVPYAASSYPESATNRYWPVLSISKSCGLISWFSAASQFGPLLHFSQNAPAPWPPIFGKRRPSLTFKSLLVQMFPSQMQQPAQSFPQHTSQAETTPNKATNATVKIFTVIIF